jgi:hypothetical protein
VNIAPTASKFIAFAPVAAGLAPNLRTNGSAIFAAAHKFCAFCTQFSKNIVYKAGTGFA